MLGYARDQSGIEPGKLAGLLVLNRDTLNEIHNTSTIRYVMKDNEVFNADTLDEV